MFGEVKNSTSYWNLVNRATNPKSRRTIGPIRRSDDSLALQDKDEATSLNSYFATIGEKLNNLLPPPVITHPVPDGLALGEVPQLSEFHLSEIAVKRKVRELQVKKSMGPDNIHPKLLKLAGEAIAPALLDLFRYSIDSGTVFSDWKIARLTPIHKKDDESDPANYRSVSLLSIPSKILESQANDNIVQHVFKENNLASDREWAYRPGFSTELLLIHLTETWRRLVDEGNVVALAFIDFKKAFDSVNHEILISKLQQNFGICDPFLTWLKSYLYDRRQFTVVNGTKSEFLPVNYGIPQGSVLGPTLFTLFTNDLPSAVKSGELFMYADDTTVYSIGAENVDQAVAQLNKALEELYTWCLNNRLTPHPIKCETFLVSRSSFVGPIAPVRIGDSFVNQVNKSRLLGTVVDNKLSWTPHLMDLKKRFAIKLALLKRCKFLPKNVLEAFYLAVILPTVTYGLPLWGCCSNKELFNSVEKLHSTAAKIIFNLGSDTPHTDNNNIYNNIYLFIPTGNKKVIH